MKNPTLHDYMRETPLQKALLYVTFAAMCVRLVHTWTENTNNPEQSFVPSWLATTSVPVMIVCFLSLTAVQYIQQRRHRNNRHKANGTQPETVTGN